MCPIPPLQHVHRVSWSVVWSVPASSCVLSLYAICTAGGLLDGMLTCVVVCVATGGTGKLSQAPVRL